MLLNSPDGGFGSCLKVINEIRAKHGAQALQWSNDKIAQQEAKSWAEHENSAGKVMPDPNLEDDVSSGISAMVTGGGSPVDKCKRAVKQW